MADKIKITFWPFLIITVFVTFFLIIGIIIDKNRTSYKLEKITNQIEKIYQAHTREFIEIAILSDIVRASNLLDTINAPEKGIYLISVLRKTPGGWNFYKGGYPYQNNNYSDYDVPLNSDQIDKLNKILSPQQTTITLEPIFDHLWWDKNNIYAFTPIKDKDSLVGYVVLKVGKAQNLD